MTEITDAHAQMKAWLDRKKQTGSLSPKAQDLAENVLTGLLTLQDWPIVPKLRVEIAQKIEDLKTALAA